MPAGPAELAHGLTQAGQQPVEQQTQQAVPPRNTTGVAAGNTAGNASLDELRVIGLGVVGSPRATYYLALAVLALVVVGLRSFRATSAGRALIAVRDNERVASAHGLSPTAVKVLALGLSGFVAGVAGALWAGVQHSWSAQLIDPSFSITMLGLAIVVGVGRL